MRALFLDGFGGGLFVIMNFLLQRNYTAFIFSFLATAIFISGGCARQQQSAADGEFPRVVSLAPNITEIICALGAGKTLVGRTSACDYPPEIIKDIPVVGGFGAPSMETLMQARPGIVLYVDLEDEAVADLIKGYGIRYARVPCARLEDVSSAIRIIGGLIGRDRCAAELAGDFERRMAEMRLAAGKSSPATNRPSVFVEIWSDPLMTAGAGSLINDLIILAGGINIAGEINKEYFSVSAEWVMARDPDIIICLDNAGAQSVSLRAGWSNLKAVRSGRVFAGLNNNIILRAGPRVLEGAAVLRECIRNQTGSMVVQINGRDALSGVRGRQNAVPPVKELPNLLKKE